MHCVRIWLAILLLLAEIAFGQHHLNSSGRQRVLRIGIDECDESPNQVVGLTRCRARRLYTQVVFSAKG